ncbi:MAG: hypothetical protein ACRDUV_18285 [Pseudonocardiaceae bacterium]
MASIALRRHGHHDTATTLLATTALDLGADSGDPAPELLAPCCAPPRIPLPSTATEATHWS